MNNIPLLPPPRRISRRPGQWELPRVGFICVEGRDPGLLLAVKSLEKSLQSRAGRWCWIETAPPPKAQAIHLRLDAAIEHEQGYTIDIRPDRVEARAKTPVGLFYAVQTLHQITRSCRRSWPCLHIADQPDFARRGFYHDISRGKVPKVQTILWLVEKLAELKINEFQLYIENVYAFKRHREMYADTTPLTARELKRIDKACRLRHIDFVPSLTSLGHFEKILRHPRYRPLAEAEPADLKQRGLTCWSDDPWSLCVTDPRAKTLITEMYADFLPNFSSSQFNICCDEAYDLGVGRSQAEAQKQGVGRLYVEWIKFCADAAAEHGKRVQLWGDIILKYPELIRELPANATVLEWGYGAQHPFLEHGKLFASCGRPFYVCPGTSSWGSLAGRTANALANLRAAATGGLQRGAVGYLNTDWGDNGHQQLLAVSLLPMAFGAAVAWNHGLASDAAIIDAVSAQLFADSSGRIAQLAADIGNVYQRINRDPLPNSSLDFHLFREPWAQTTYLEKARQNRMASEIARLERHLATLKQLPSPNRDLALVWQELSFTIRVIRHTLRRTMLRAQPTAAPESARREIAALIADIRRLRREFKVLWRKRNKKSRWADVDAHFKRMELEYRRLR